MVTEPAAHWLPITDGYKLVNGPIAATLTRLFVGDMWTVQAVGYAPVVLGRRASFDAADAVVGRLAAQN